MRTRTVLAFAAIFIIWGSTYLAIRYAVAEIPPLLTAGVRHLTAGSLLFAWAWAKGGRPTAIEWRHSAVVGGLFFLIGHGSLHWAEQSVPSGLSALLVATEPVWIALLLAMTGRTPLQLRTAAGLIVGLVGVWLIVRVDGLANDSLLTGSLAVLVGAASWGAGVVYSQRAPLPADPILRTSTTLLSGAAMLLAAAVIFGEPGAVRPPSPLALWSLAYLIVFGSVVSFSAYYWLLDRYSATVVATHTYVNPAVAVLLGSLVGGEPMSAKLLVGLAVVSSAIALVSMSPRQPEVCGDARVQPLSTMTRRGVSEPQPLKLTR
jgi:drug/metabolite transporter (DMT)-like permease